MWRSLSIAGLGLMLLSPNAAAQPASPPRTQPANADDQQGADRYGQADMNCRHSAAARSGYHAPDQATDTAASSNLQERYASAYYACMSRENGGPPPPNGSGPPPPNGFGPDGYAYGPPPPPYYGGGPYPYPYPYASYYPPYYYGPAVSFGFDLGGFHGGHGGGHR
jgi:hypothetical protein